MSLKPSPVPDVPELTARVARPMEAGTDHFGVWVVEISYGRIGTAGSRSYALRDEAEARHLTQDILKPG